MQPSVQTIRVHAAYIRWTKQAVNAANLAWYGKHRYAASPLMTRDGLHSWIYERGLEGGWILPLGKKLRSKPISYDIAQVFQRNPETVKNAARDYWRHLLKERRQP